MNKSLLLASLAPLAAAPLFAQSSEGIENLPAVTVYSPRVANQEPAETFTMPISSLRFDPRVDVQARNLAEGQADVSIRGGIFENTGFKLGALSLYDPQTGHYFAELPVAPVFLGTPDIRTGVRNAIDGFNANVGSVSYGFRKVQTAGFTSIGAGEKNTNRQELYQGYSASLDKDTQLGADVDVARSESDGPIRYGDHAFSRVNGRVQLVSPLGQTDFLAAYQHKFFGWPDLYTPFNVNESENLQTVLLLANHRKDFGGGDYIEAGVFWRRNKDDYEYNRLIPGLYNPYQHTTWVYGASLQGRNGLGVQGLALDYSAQAMFDALKSTSLVYGPFSHRDYYKLSAVPEYTWKSDTANQWSVKAGASYDDTNKGSAAGSPIVQFNHTNLSADSLYAGTYLSYAKSTQVATYTALKSNPKGGLFRGNPNLGRSSSQNLELGVHLRPGAWTLTAAAFVRRDLDLVDWTYSYSLPSARNANPVDIDTAGVELVASRSWKRVDLTLGYTALTKDADYKLATVSASFYALNYAKQRLTAALVCRLGAGFELRLDNEARIQEPNALRKGATDVVISSAGLAWRTTALPALELSAQVENLWNSDFQEVPAVPFTPRQFSVGAQYTW
jgi:hypothetical protein